LSNIPQDICKRAKILWLNYPNNPTAALATLEFFAQAVEFCRQNQILLCHDAAYTQVTFENTYAPSVLEVPGSEDVCLEFNTLSKSHNMAGWRVGAVIGNSEALAALPPLEVAKRAENRGKTVVTILCDTGERYLSTSLFTP